MTYNALKNNLLKCLQEVIFLSYIFEQVLKPVGKNTQQGRVYYQYGRGFE